MLENLRRIRPTRRGWAVAAIATGAFALGAVADARSLNAVVVPAIVAVGASAIQLARAEAPTISRSIPDPGFPGESRRVTVTIESAVPCEVTDSLDRELARHVLDDDPTAAVGHGGSFEYDIEFQRRGVHRLGPSTCRLSDSLGLFAVDRSVDVTTTVLVYPEVYDIETARLDGVIDGILGDDRSSFDRLREFTPGDTMRDIHWRASAKRPGEEFVVAEYRGRSEATHVDIVGESSLGSADAMASTVASLASHLHDIGVSVGVTVPEGRRLAHPGDTESLLRLLARTGDGWVDDAQGTPDIRVRGDGGRATVMVPGRELDADSIVGDRRKQGVVP